MYELLLVEDNPGDALLAREVFGEGPYDVNIHHVSEGNDALSFLKQDGRHASAPRPDLILLDLNLPGKDGRELLADIKNDDDLRSIPVIVLSTSTAYSDMEYCYSLHANCYVSKPISLVEFTDVVRRIESFWFGLPGALQAAEKRDAS